MNNMNDDTKEIMDVVLNNLLKMNENDITKEVLMPLLMRIGWGRVDFHGGPYEEGKDVICWRRDELDSLELGVAQVKKYKPTAVASDDKSFMELVNQLQQASEKSVPSVDDGKTYKPSIVYVVTPFKINTRSLMTRFEGYQVLKERNLKIIDGISLFKLLFKHNPEIIEKYSGAEETLTQAIKKSLNNDVFLRALNVQGQEDIANFYCDLDFTIGNINTRLFHGISLCPKKSNVDVSFKEWEKICRAEDLAFENGRSLLSYKREKINNKFNKIIEEQNNLANKTKKLRDKQKGCEKLIEEKIDRLRDIEEVLRSDDLLDESLNIRRLGLNLGRTSFGEDYDLNKFYGEVYKIIEEVGSVNKIEDSIILEDIHSLSRECLKKIKEREKIKDDIISLQQEIRVPTCKFEFDGCEFAELIYVLRGQIQEKTNYLNGGSFKLSELKDFLASCERVFCLTNDVLSLKSIASTVGFDPDQEYASIDGYPRLSVGIDRIIEAGRSLAIYGEAGAGKTTSMQMFAKRSLSCCDTSSFLLYVPLAAAIVKSENKNEVAPIDKVKSLMEIICNYLRSEGAAVDTDYLITALGKPKSILLLDGIDEALMLTPWLPEAIFEISERFNGLQLVVSARSGENYRGRISFLGTSLLPFTDKQRESFIAKWLQGSEYQELANNVVDHLSVNKEIGNIVRNPLLTTILCTLAKSNVPLPNSEIQLYEERLRLLFGDYDIAKKISRVRSYRQHLETVARRIAYKLHKSHRRDCPFSEINDFVARELADTVGKELAINAAEELFSPCNILVPMTPDGNVGFGHLRHQEYLTAKELHQNRGIEIGHLLFDPWWKGVLVIYAKMTDSITDIIDWLIQYQSANCFIKAKENFEAMLAVRPDREKQHLSEIFYKYLELDERDPYIQALF